MPPDNDPGYARLLLLVGGIASDVKNILVRQDNHDARITRHENRQHVEMALLSARIRVLEQFRWRLVGITTALTLTIPVAVTYFLRGVM